MQNYAKLAQLPGSRCAYLINASSIISAREEVVPLAHKLDYPKSDSEFRKLQDEMYR